MDIYTCILLGALLVIREYQHRKTESELMDRIMCKDWKEYKKHTKSRVAPRGLASCMTDEEMAAQEEKE